MRFDLDLVFLTIRKVMWCIILVMSVCQMITYESLDIGSSYQVKVKVTGAKKVENSYSRSVKLDRQ